MDDRLSPRHRATVPETVHARQFDEEVIVLDLGAGAYFSLDPVGSVVWAELAAGRCFEEAAGEVVARFDVEYERALHDVLELGTQLVSAGLLVAAPPSGS